MLHLLRLCLVVLLLGPVVSRAYLVGDFTPLRLGNRWTYVGSIGTVFPTLSSERGVLVRRADSIFRSVEVIREILNGDTSLFEITKKDSVLLRLNTYVFQKIDSNGILSSRTVDSLEKHDSIAIELDSVVIVGGEIVVNKRVANCNCIPIQFMDNMFRRRMYADSQVSDTSYKSENRKYVSGMEMSSGQIGFKLEWTKIKDIGMENYNYSRWSSSSITLFDKFKLLNFENTYTSIIKPNIISKKIGDFKVMKSASAYFLDFNNKVDIRGKIFRTNKK